MSGGRDAHDAGSREGTGLGGFVGMLVRARDWWREPHFLGKTAILGLIATLAELILVPPASPVQMLLALCWMGVIALLPLRPRTVCVEAPVLFLAAGFLPDGWWWATGGTTQVVVFLAIGYVLSNRAVAGLLVVYSVADAACFALFDTASVGGSAVRGFIDGFNESSGIGDLIPAHPETALSSYTLIVGVATVAVDVMVLGFLVVFGAAFRRASAADERAERVETMLGRVTREQELAHMIHDSVANDMSTIAMLAWRAKAMDDDAAMLDAIYARSHHALDRVHEVIDVLNGRRDLAGLEGEIAAEAGGVGGEGTAASSDGDGTGNGGAGTGASGATNAPIGDLAFDTQLEKYVEDQDRTMAMLGLRGVTRFNGAPDVVVPKPVRRVVMGLVEEIYANIVRHCAMGDVGAVAGADAEGRMTDGPDASAVRPAADGAAAAEGHDATGVAPAYTLFIDIAADGIRISEVNALADESATLVHGRRHGGGLAMHRAAVEALGGTLNTSEQDGTWTIGAHIPF
ncbi:hypothetical protein JS528_09140 [Bifidobacterium sp. MA2]|uniref:Histidine kinase n=1 Tax=Bifidobacterium santillanense TaxID=2809028 RepID=A0ABS5URQ8_9BIFI|nr:hypothetical protein [Bifidobacterium santillanense]MBT1173501.1 hypothetical protein [Bifidobacterium santillanense]